MDGGSVACREREPRCGPRVQTAKNVIHKQSNDNATESATKPTVEDHEPAAAVSFKDGMREPGAQNARRYTSKNAALN